MKFFVFIFVFFSVCGATCEKKEETTETEQEKEPPYVDLVDEKLFPEQE